MSAKDKPVSQPANDAYRNGWDRLWGKRVVRLKPGLVDALERECNPGHSVTRGGTCLPGLNPKCSRCPP